MEGTSDQRMRRTATAVGRQSLGPPLRWRAGPEELEDAAATGNQHDIEEELGDLLFAVVNLARHLEVDPEKALTGANHKFERRFRDMEEAIRGSGRALDEMTLEALETEWRAAKKRVG